MYRILKKRKLAEKIWLMDIQADRIAAKCLPGEFLIVKIDKQGERVPLTICDYNRETGVITIVFQVVGASTYRMAEELNEGDAFQDVVGPLGRPSELTEKTPEELQKMNILFVAGGVGTAPVYPQVKWLKEQGVSADVVQGSKNKDLVILEDDGDDACLAVVVADRQRHSFSLLVDLYDEEFSRKTFSCDPVSLDIHQPDLFRQLPFFQNAVHVAHSPLILN